VQCVILAGGLGTRMQPLTNSIPKALVPVAGKPFVDHQLRWLAGQGVRDVVFCIGYRGEQLRGYVGDGSRWRVSVRYVDEGEELRGTGGALRLAVDEGVLDDACLVLNGDSYLPIEIAPIWKAFRESGARALMVVFRNENRWDASNAVYADGRIVLYDKRSAGQRPELKWIDYGLAALTRDLARDRIAPGETSDLADLFHELSLDGELAGFEVSERFYEVGSQEGLRELANYLSGD
jgi:NDP-sugar pyrophosphorylase family protein